MLDAGRRIAARDFSKVSDTALLSRMSEEARGKVWRLDLATLGIRHAKRPPDLFDDAGGLLDLYCNGERQPLSRWPNDTNATIARVLDSGNSSRGKRAHGATFAYREDRAARWAEAAKAGQLWLAGYWRVPWEYRVAHVKTLDPGARTITLTRPLFLGIGSKYAVLLTQQLMHPGSFLLHEALCVWLRGGAKSEMQASSGQAYAKNQGISVRAATGVFAVIDRD